MKTLIELFNLGMLRNYPDIIPDVYGIVLNLGPGEKHIDGAIELDWPEWDAETMPIPFADNSVDMIHCYHFLEHIANTHFIMKEIQRVLKPGGHINIVVPHYKAQIMAQDPDHKTAFCETTWNNVFSSHKRYSKGKIDPMKIHMNMLIGDCEKNIVLITQLVKL